MLESTLARLKEPSTWSAAAAALVGIVPTLPADVTIPVYGLIVFSVLLGAILPEARKADPEPPAA